MAHRGSWRRSAELRVNNGNGDADDGDKSGRAGWSIAATQKGQASPSDAEQNASGPAAPLKPLQISPTTVVFPARPLPHPSTYAGTDNWAFTPSDTMPSLPATPSRVTRDQLYTGASWSAQRGPLAGAVEAGPPNGQPVRPTSRDGGQHGIQPLSARSVFNRRLEEHRTQSPSPVRNQRPSPRMAYAGLMGTASASPLSATLRSTSASEASSHMHAPVASAQQPAASISAVLTQAANSSESSPALRHRESFTSAASSSAAGLGQHPLTHSRRPSQIFVQSPTSPTSYASGSGVNNVRASPAYRVYRPPHMRTDSYFALQPRMAHYDRVTAPTMRGQSRSPSMSLSNSGSSAVSRTTSERPSLSSEQAGRRLSMLGVQNTLIHNAPTAISESEQQNPALDSRSLIAKLAKARLNLSQSTAESSPQGSDRMSIANRQAVVEDDEFDLTAEDMMMMSGTLTDQYCRSRSSSMSLSDVDASVDIFDVGDRIGPGLTHDGHVITIAETTEGFHDQSADWSGTQLEIMSKLGEGSYATVYLVKEVARRGSDAFIDGGDETVRREADGDLLSSTLKASPSGRLAEEQGNRTIIGRDQLEINGEKYFALKCLCKRDLSDDMLEVQRLEATIHQSIPPHPNIVTLYRTYETPEWLFLVLEYCPGQDLFYWLEQAQDAKNLGSVTPGDNGSNGSVADIHEIDSTPPSPGLLASTETRHLLSRRRLRLISRMFLQMCEAVEFCHSQGIAHRDIKPENFIVEDTRASSLEQTANGTISTMQQSIDGVKVKLTDFGLAVAQTHCIDFDCGSKPYMSYECRNNTAKSYNPMQSDVWSLGIVLLNLIFHRNPFSEPNPERCSSFASYIDDPVFFLTTAFRGLKEEAATFLAANVFCDVTEEDEKGRSRQRISARKLGEWASNLSEHLYVKGNVNLLLLKNPQQFGDAGADLGITSPLWHSRSPTSSHVNSLLASPASNTRSLSIQREFTQMGITDEEMESFTPLFADSTVTDRPRPPSTPFRASMGTTADEGLKQIDEERIVPDTTSTSDTIGRSDVFSDKRSSHLPEKSGKEVQEEPEVTDVRQSDTTHTYDGQDQSKDEMENDDASNPDGDTDKNSIPPSTTSTTAKRRKRGARKGRTLAKQQMKRSRSVENLQASASVEHGERPNETERDRIIRELAEASQSLAREMSKAMQVKEGVANSVNATANSIPQKPTAAALMSTSGSTSTMNGAIRSARPIHASSTVSDWRERNGSHASLASVSSFDTVNSFSSEVASIRSTASAPPALLRTRGPISSFGGLTTVSTTSSRHSGLSAWRTGATSGRIPSSTAPLDTINERGGASSQRLPATTQQKDLDASYLAEIFGGRPSARSSQAQQQKAQQTDQPSSSVQAKPSLAVTNTQKLRNPLGVENGALDGPSVRPSGAGPSEPITSQSVLEAPRKKMLGKFLQGVKSYNKGVKAAPAMSASTVDPAGDHRSNSKKEESS